MATKGPKIDLTGQRFGKLVAKEPLKKEPGETGPTKWLCQCDCGNTVIVPSKRLTGGFTKSCGCLRGKKNLIGQRFGFLVVVKEAPTVSGKARWECQCDCGNTTIVDATDLVTSNTRSCGCRKGKKFLNEHSYPQYIHKSDLTNQSYGRLTAIAPTDQRKGGCVVWDCICTCGNHILVSSSHLKNGKVKSCGCLIRPIRDISYQRFGRLVAIRPMPKQQDGIRRPTEWECQCDCGNITYVYLPNLVNGLTKSCGCLRNSRKKKTSTTKEIWTLKIKPNFMLREVAGEALVIPTGDAAMHTRSLIGLTESSYLLFNQLQKECTRDELLTSITDVYDVPVEVASADLDAVLNHMRQLNMLEERAMS